MEAGTVTIPTWEIIVAIIGAVLGSTGLFTFIQYLISRKDKKNDKFEILQKSIDELKDEVEAVKNSLRIAIETLSDKIDRSQAVQARIRILRANDEMRQDVHHSYEYFRQLHQDITEYESYCNTHPDFKNNEAVNSIEYINRVYQDCLDSNNFLV